MLFIRGGAVGDFILTLPAMQLVREQLPAVDIEVLGYPGISRLATSSGIATDTRSIEFAALANFFVPGAELDEDLQRYFSSFEVVVSYLFDPDGFFHSNLERAGVQQLVVASHRVKDREPGHPSAATQLAAPLESLALYLDRPFVELNFDPETVQAGDAFMAHAATQAGRLVALHPGSGSPTKNWPLDRWIELARTLTAEVTTELELMVVGGEAEAETIDAFVAQLDDHGIAHRLARDLPLPVLGAALQRCDLFLGHDSGISHLAAACGLPCLLLFGPTRPEVWAPRNPKVEVLAAPEGQLTQLEPETVRHQAGKMIEALETSG
jgi:heptosyltransferase-2